MIVVPDAVWTRMLDVFCRELEDRERIAYLDGFVGPDGLGVVTTLTFPRARSEARNFIVTAEAMSAAGKHLRVLHMRRIAQVHTHPGSWTGHSRFDDENAYSQRVGAASVVLPHYARGRPTPAEAGIHVRTKEGWTELDRAEARAFVRLVPTEINWHSEGDDERNE